MEVRAAGWDDFDAVVDLLAARERAVHGIADLRPEHVRVDWELPSFSVGADHWVAVEDGRVVGYAAISPSQELTHAAPVAGDELLQRALARARELDFERLRVFVSPDDIALIDVVDTYGFARETEIVRMWKRLDGGSPAPTWPAGVHVRTYEAGDAAAVKALLDHAYAGWDDAYAPQPLDDWVRWMTGDYDFDPAVWWLAEEDGELVGCVLNWRSGWVKDIAVRTSHRGRGLGKALLLHSFSEFHRRNVSRIGLKVDAANPTGAPQLYEGLGFVADRREEIRTLWL
ncbi:MAG: GNAT family N-acetyltransferase [Actinobacteria bacterium]|nr:GNAT family N-acetyltransferase [Actinomycetota bacterium]